MPSTRASSASSSPRPAATTEGSTEDTSPTRQSSSSPVSLYAETKVAARRMLERRQRAGADCLRFATVYGTSPRMRFDLTVNEFTRDLGAQGRAGRLRRAVLATVCPRPRRRPAIVQCSRAPAGGRRRRGLQRRRHRRELPQARHRRAAQRAVPGREGRVRAQGRGSARLSRHFEKFAASIGFELGHTVGNGIDELRRSCE